MTFHYKLSHLIFLIILSALTQNLFSQKNVSNKLTTGINISKTKSTDIIWERVPFPENNEILTMKVMPGNKIYVGARNGGVYQLMQDEWELIGLSDRGVFKLEEYLNGELLASVFNSIFIWDYVDWTEIQNPISGYVTKTLDVFFCGGGFDDLYRSSDGCYNWDFVHDFSGCELVNGIVGTSPDSIFLGYKNYCNGEGGVLLSTDSGYNFNPFGLHTHAISSMAIDNNNHIYAGSLGNWDTELCGLYRYNYQTEIWDTIIIYSELTCIEFNSENHIYLGYGFENLYVEGGILHSEDNGESWIFDTIGMGSTWVHDLQIAENGILYALAEYPTKQLYRTVLPVEIKDNTESFHYKTNCYPNPTSNKLTISPLKKCNDNKPTNLIIYNTSGHEIMHHKISIQEFLNGFIELNVSDLERGEYIYSIKSENYITTNKFIKQ